jgi:hypothetical protein
MARGRERSSRHKFEGVFRYGHRDSHGSLCRSPDAQHCT